MKTLIGLFLTLTAFSATAGEITIYDRAIGQSYGISSYSQDFDMNPELGRVWVSVKFNDGSEGPSYDEDRIKLEGLSFNATTSQIQLDVDGVQTICANVKLSRRSYRIRPTGNCTFKQKHYSVKVDDGFEVRTVEKLKILLKY
jgi:hypothetical protein